MLRALDRAWASAPSAMLALAQVQPAAPAPPAPWIYTARRRAADRRRRRSAYIGKGAQRWLDLGFVRFQPSEIMKLAVPMMCAWYLHERPLPPDRHAPWRVLLAIIAGAGRADDRCSPTSAPRC